jgi:hypothetical protein
MLTGVREFLECGNSLPLFHALTRPSARAHRNQLRRTKGARSRRTPNFGPYFAEKCTPGKAADMENMSARALIRSVPLRYPVLQSLNSYTAVRPRRKCTTREITATMRSR